MLQIQISQAMNDSCIYAPGMNSERSALMSDHPTMPTRARPYEQLTDDERKLVRALQ